MATGTQITCPRCRATVESNKLFCMSCGAPIAKSSSKTPLQTFKTPPAVSPSALRPPQQSSASVPPPVSGVGQITLLTCQNCGGQLDYSPGSSVASCPFCGGKSLVGTPTTEVQRLRDLDGLSLQMVHYQPRLSADDARQVLVAAMKSDPASVRDAHGLSMQVSMVSYPAWRVQVQVQCAWQGQYPERRAVTKYRTVRRPTGRRVQHGLSNSWMDEYANFQEPYTDYETVWHPCSGTAFATPDFYVPAAPGISMRQLRTATVNADNFPSIDGAPPVSGRFAMARPSLTQARAWQQFDCDAFVEMSAREQCGDPGVVVNHVSQVVLSKTFSLVFFPMAVISYDVAGGEYRHFVSLLNGDFSGDLPKDLGAIKAEAESARKADKQFVQNCQVIAILALGIALYTIPPLWEWMGAGFPEATLGFHLVLAVLCVVGLGTAINRFGAIRDGQHRSWRAFLSKRGPALVRVLLNPPPNLSQLKTAMPSQSLTPLQKAADDNTLEAAMATDPGQEVADFIAEFILSDGHFRPKRRSSSIGSIVKVTVLVISAAFVVAILWNNPKPPETPPPTSPVENSPQHNPEPGPSSTPPNPAPAPPPQPEPPPLEGRPADATSASVRAIGMFGDEFYKAYGLPWKQEIDSHTGLFKYAHNAGDFHVWIMLCNEEVCWAGYQNRNGATLQDDQVDRLLRDNSAGNGWQKTEYRGIPAWRRSDGAVIAYKSGVSLIFTRVNGW